MKKFIYILFAFLGALLIFFILSTYVISDASTSLSDAVYQKANESGNYHEFLQLSHDFIKKMEDDTIPDDIKLYQTVNYDYANKIFIYRYFLFVSNLKENPIIDDFENVNKIPHLKVFLKTEGEDELIYYSAEDEKVVGTEDAPPSDFDLKDLDNLFFSFPIKKNGDFQVELLTNSGNIYETIDFTHQEEELTETITREDFKQIFEQKEDYINKIDSDLFYKYLNQHMKNYIVWLGMIFYILFTLGLYFLFFGKHRVKFKKKNYDFE